jgi:2-keto-3-deoxy-L-rhamnonate aldolase RhmA
VDCLSFGPSDLSFSLEAHPEHPFKTVDDCVRHVVQQLQGMATKVCFRNYTPDLRDTYIKMGVTVLLERPRS